MGRFRIIHNVLSYSEGTVHAFVLTSDVGILSQDGNTTAKFRLHASTALKWPSVIYKSLCHLSADICTATFQTANIVVLRPSCDASDRHSSSASQRQDVR
jgi:hypothetical protein